MKAYCIDPWMELEILATLHCPLQNHKSMVEILRSVSLLKLKTITCFIDAGIKILRMS